MEAGWTLLTAASAFGAGIALARGRAAASAARADERVAALSSELEAGRREAARRETLLRTIVDTAPMAIVLLGDLGSILYTNPAARDLFFEGKDPTGANLLAMLGQAPAPFREALLGSEDALFTVDFEGAPESFHLAKRVLEPDGESLTLIMVRNLTRELQRQEVAVWKKLLRVISHELNNSLAPISSMAHSARLIAKNPAQLHRLDQVFATIEERTSHLKEFLEGYARLARLPAPRRAHTRWSEFLAHVREAWPGVAVGEAPSGTGWFDAAQVEQVVLNLLKNAEEAGSPREAIALDVEREPSGFTIAVRDRGPGMSDDVLRNALLPFYSTKDRGTGLGLALCREVVEAHGGKVRLQNREGGGLEIACFLPNAESTGAQTTARLTITHT